MIVVSDTSPLTNLAAIRQFHLLERLYGEVYISSGVWDELNVGGKRWPGSDEVASALILLDEKEGRRAAQRLGLRTVGVVGFLLEAKALGEIQYIRPHLDALRQTAGFFLSEVLYRTALKAAGEG